MAIDTLAEKFLFELGGLYDAEHRFLDAMRPMMEQARNETLRLLIEEHVDQTRRQIRNLELVYSHLGLPPTPVGTAAAAGLVEDGATLTREIAENPQLHDAAIACSLARVEHHEVACYRGLLSAAELLGRPEAQRLLRENLDQEERTLRLLEQQATLLVQKAEAAGAGGTVSDLKAAAGSRSAAGPSATPTGSKAGRAVSSPSAARVDTPEEQGGRAQAVGKPISGD